MTHSSPRRLRTRAALAALLSSSLSGCASQPAKPDAPPGDNSKGDRMLVVPTDEGNRRTIAEARPWGPSKSDAATESKTRAALSHAAAGDAIGFASPVILGPALWSRLVAADAGLARIGTRGMNVQPNHDTGIAAVYATRSFDGESGPALLGSSAARDLAKRFAAGRVRAASEAERRAYYREIPFEIDKEPLAVLEDRGEVLLLQLVDGKASWIELISDWPDHPPPELRVTPAERAEIQRQAGSMHFGQKLYRVALAAYRACVEAAPDDDVCLFNGGTCAYLANDFATARAFWERARKIDPDLRTRSKLVQVYQALGETALRDRERDDLLAWKRKSTDKEVREADFYTREQFLLGPRRVMAQEAFPPEEKPTGPFLIYRFLVGDDATEKAEPTFLGYFSQPAPAELVEKGFVARGAIIYSLARFRDGNVLDALFWIGPEEIPYDAVRAIARDVLTGVKKPLQFE